jgi:hypothetical protein
MAKSGGTSVIKGAAVVFIMGLTLIIVMMAAMEMQGGGRASSPPTEKIANKNLREARGVVAKTPQIAEPPPSLISDPLVGLPENSLYRLTATNILGEPLPLASFAGKVTLVVNVACK